MIDLLLLISSIQLLSMLKNIFFFLTKQAILMRSDVLAPGNGILIFWCDEFCQLAISLNNKSNVND